MADQGVWFKLWVSALADPDLSNLSLEDFARWAILGTYIKAHGQAGRLRLTAPARALCGLLQVGDFAALQDVFHRLPNVVEEKEISTVSSETILTVSYRNWSKYQGDYSTNRVRRMREMKRSKRRGEEIRGDEKRKEVTTLSSSPPSLGIEFQIPESVQQALKRCHLLSTTPKLSQPRWWQAELRANPGIDLAGELLKAEAWLVTNRERAPRKDLARFFHNWLARADRRTDDG